MPITLKFDHPHFPDDAEFGVGMLGQVKNHGTIEVDDDMAAAFEASNGISVEAAFRHNALCTVNGVKGTPRQEAKDEHKETTTITTTGFELVTNDETPDEGGEQ